MIARVQLALAVACLVPWFPARAGQPAQETNRLVLIVNTRVAAGSDIAARYAAHRGVPESRICRLDLPDGETMSRADYESKLRDPLLAFLREAKLIEQVRRAKKSVGDHESGWDTVSASLDYLVPVYGVPLRIDDTKPWPLDKIQAVVQHGGLKDEAAVDSELCLLLQDRYDLRGRIGNPLYAHRSVEAAGLAVPVLRVCRLDGPDPATVLRMLEGAWSAEETGWLGRAYIDRRAEHSDSYLTGDWWFDSCARILTDAGFPVDVNRSDAVFGDLYPMDNAAVYLGWYTETVIGPFASTGFSFRAGALAYHLHSGNARSLRTTTEHWAGPLLARGAGATFGSVAEPFLTYTPDPSIVLDRLVLGENFGDAVCLATPALSWQTTVIGDPLYRPFGLTLDEQIRRMEAAGNADVAWAHLRKINLLVRDGRLNIALAYARDQLRKHEGHVLRERVAELYGINNMPDEALAHYEKAIATAPDAAIAVRVGMRCLLMLRLLKRDDDAARIDASLREAWPGSPYLGLLDEVRP